MDFILEILRAIARFWIWLIILLSLNYCAVKSTNPQWLTELETTPQQLAPTGFTCGSYWDEAGKAECWQWVNGQFETVVIQRPVVGK